MVRVGQNNNISQTNIINPTNPSNSNSTIWDNNINNNNEPLITLSNNKEEQKKLAKELLIALNDSDLDKINDLLLKLNSSNIRNVYSYYLLAAQENNEIAATPREQKKLRFGKRFIKAFPKRTESLLQGIMNNENLPLEKKEEYLIKLTNLFIDHAKYYLNNNIKRKDGSVMTEELIENFKVKTMKNIKNCTLSELESRQNTLEIEKDIKNLYGY